MIIVARQDHTVTPAPVLKFAELLKAETLILEGDCGHSLHLCESAMVNSAIEIFLLK